MKLLLSWLPWQTNKEGIGGRGGREVERKDKERRRKAQPSYSQRVSAVLKKWRWREGAMSVGSSHVLLCFNLFTSSSLRSGHVLCQFSS